MTLVRPKDWDPLAVIPAVVAIAMIGGYVALIIQQRGQVAYWFIAAMVTAAVLLIYGVPRTAPHRVPTLAVAGALMTLLGLVSILSIGCPILLAGAIAIVAAVRANRPVRGPGI
jgi:uncharacterized membrane protein (UPF0136 family)